MNLYQALESAIYLSDRIDKKQELKFDENEKRFLDDCLEIFKIFIKTTVKLQADKWLTIIYIYPYIYQIRIELEEKI